MQLKIKQFRQQSKLVFYRKFPVETWKEDYVGETDRWIEGNFFNHKKQDKNLHLLKHSCEKNHQSVWEKDFNVLANNYCSNFKRKISEAFLIKQLNPSLNVKKKSIQPQLYNWVTIPEASTCLKLAKNTHKTMRFEHVNVYRYITWVFLSRLI